MGVGFLVKKKKKKQNKQKRKEEKIMKNQDFYGNISLKTNIKKIKVNDNDYISINVNDAGFFDKFADLMSWVDEENKNINDMISKKGKTGEIDDVISVIKAQANFCEGCTKKIDDMFGVGSRIKIFGEITPDYDMLIDFFNQLTPIIAKIGQERNNNISEKYNRNRTGAKLTKSNTNIKAIK